MTDQPFNARAFSVLGFANPGDDIDATTPLFAAYSPSLLDAQADRDAYRAAYPNLRLWVVVDHATGKRTLTLGAIA